MGPADPRFVRDIQYDLHEAGIKDIKKFVPAILFEIGTDPKNQKQELWVDLPPKFDNKFDEERSCVRLYSYHSLG